MSDTPIQSIGYIGMGIMGSTMAANLLKAGFAVTVWNRTSDKCDALRDKGAQVAMSPADLGSRGLDVVCINVTDTPDVESVLFGVDGLAASAKTGLIVIDHSTISPAATQAFAGRLSQKGVTLLDAPVSGGDSGARAGTLSIMVGGPAEVFERCRPVFQAVGKAIAHLGPSGMGQVCKACNQVAVSCNLMGVCEALELAKELGLDRRKMIEVVAAGAGASWQLANLGPKIIAQDFAPGFMIDLVLKDLALVAEAAHRQGLDLRGVEAARAYLQQVADNGGGRLGTQAMAKAVGRQ
ncbi:MAG: NAD(P)-dependent oxidoreductase [Phycisphaeraceae bacterium]